jgi:hypothetical protein
MRSHVLPDFGYEASQMMPRGFLGSILIMLAVRQLFVRSRPESRRG